MRIKSTLLQVAVVITLVFGGVWQVSAQDEIQDQNLGQPTHQVFLPLISDSGQDNQAADIAAAQAGIPEQHKALLNKARQNGSVMVIVGLALPNSFQAEGDLSSSAVVTEQRAAIAQRQQALLQSLAQYNLNAYATYQTVPAIALKVDAAGLQALLASAQVATIQEDALSDPALASSTVVIGAPAAWAAGYEGAGQTVAILDTGIDGDHPFFGSRIVAQACFSNANGAGGNVSLCPNGTASQTGNGAAEAQIVACNNGTLCSHGSHVAGIAAGSSASFSGVARKANIIAIQVFTRFNSAASCSPSAAPCVRSYQSDQIKGLDYINSTLSTRYKIASANMSLGGGSYTNQATCDSSNASVKTAIDNIRSKGIATVISSGNDGFVNAMGAPGCISTAVAVGATTDADAVASFSNMHAMVDLLAPGVSINSWIPGGGFANFNGTSMAAPHVTGAWAVLKAINPTASVSTILANLQSTGLSVKDTRAGGTITKPRIRLDKAVPPKLAAPSNLSATTLDATRIQLKWTDNATNEAGFKIERCQGAGCTAFAQIATVAANTTTYINTGLSAGTTYSYRVRANNSAGDSAYSNTASATTTGSTGFNSQFNGSASGWLVDSGAWSVDANFLTSVGVTNKWATVHQVGDYANFDFETAIWRNGCNTCSSVVFFRGTPSPLNSTNLWNKGYMVTITRNRDYALWSTSGGTATALRNWTTTTALNSGSAWNIVRIVAFGSSIKFYFNGVLIWSGTNTVHTTGKIGLGIANDGSSGNQIWFDYAKLTPLTSAASLETEETNGEQQAVNKGVVATGDVTRSGSNVDKSLSIATPPLATDNGTQLEAANVVASDAVTDEVLESTDETSLQGSDDNPDAAELNQRIYLPIIQGSANEANP